MNFGKKIIVEPMEVSEELAESYYDNGNPTYQRDILMLSQLCNVFKNRKMVHPEISDKKFTCYIERKAFDAFIRFANETYQSRGDEATGLLVGYYLHDENEPESTFIVGTNFLKATGPTTRVTCEFSYEDGVKHSRYCDEHKVLSLIWIHSHPGFGAFYSGTDDSTLKSIYYAPHQAGVVVDNLQSQILGYKMYDGNKKQENIYIFDIDQSDENHIHLVYTKHVRNSPIPTDYNNTDLIDEGPSIVNNINSGEKNESTFVDNEPPTQEKNSIMDNLFDDELSKTMNKRTRIPFIALTLSFIVVISAIVLFFIQKIKEIDLRLVQIEQYLNKSKEVNPPINNEKMDSTLRVIPLVNDTDSI